VRVTGNTPCPIAFWVAMCLLHHPLALGLVMPMNAYYPWLPAYHRIAFALLGAGSVCIGLGQCKMALNVQTRAGFALFKLIVAIAFVTITYTRVVVWLVEMRAALAAFALADDANFYRGGVLCASLMSILNLTMVSDALAALLKFVPKPLPATQEALQEVQEEQATPPAVGRTLSAGIIRFRALSPSRKWRAALNMLKAGARLGGSTGGCGRKRVGRLSPSRVSRGGGELSSKLTRGAYSTVPVLPYSMNLNNIFCKTLLLRFVFLIAGWFTVTTVRHSGR